jgi:two-component system, OmpR family, response regulator VanR
MAGEVILVVDDEYEIAELVEIHLKDGGYKTLLAHDGQEAMDMLDRHQVHLVILDIMMPGIDGLEVCRRIRQTKNTPIIFLSAKSEDLDKVTGLVSGADDYLTKPFSPMELLARVRSQLRRFLYLNNNMKLESNILGIGDLRVNKENHQVFLDNIEVYLTPTEFDILELLLLNKGIVLSSETIFERVWKEKYFQSKNTVMVHIRKLREKIEKNPKQPEYLKTVWGVGYKIDG